MRGTIQPGALKDALSGTWLGHALHPLLTDVVIGSWTSATLLDVLGGDDDEAAAERLIAVGIAAYPPTALTGANDWADAEPADDGVRRAGLVHAVVQRGRARRSTSRRWRRAGAARAGGASARPGGATALMSAGLPRRPPVVRQGGRPSTRPLRPGRPDWRRAADASTLPRGRPTRVVVDETPVLLLRDGATVLAIHDRCSHRGCSLSEGQVDGSEIECACHGSRFDLRDGSVQRGPATAPQPAFQVRIDAGRVEVRRLTRPAAGPAAS